MSFARLHRILRTASFGLAILYAALFAASAVILGGIVFWTVQTSLERDMAARISAEIDLLTMEFRTEGLQELVLEVRDRQAHFPTLDYLVLDTTGERLAGNLPFMPKILGWTDMKAQRESQHGSVERQFRVRAVMLDGGIRFAVGDDLRPIEELRQAFLEALGWTVLAFLVLSLSGGLLLSMAFLRQVNTITRTAEAIIGGQLKSRIPLRGTNDNFDQLSSTLNRMLDQIQNLMESLNQVSNDIAHALRTPLGRLRQKLEIAQTHIRRNPRLETAIDAAIHEADTILDTFSALLRIAQIEAGTRQSGFRQVNLSAIFETVGEAYAVAAQEQGKELSARVESGIVYWGDRDLLTELLANLLDNAIRHTPAGAHIEVTLAKTGSQLLATVADDGPGVPPEDRERVFQRFYRVERSIGTPGNGLGLSLVAAVAELHGMQLSVQDNAPGLRMTMTLGAVQAQWEQNGGQSSSAFEGSAGGIASSLAVGKAMNESTSYFL